MNLRHLLAKAFDEDGYMQHGPDTNEIRHAQDHLLSLADKALSRLAEPDVQMEFVRRCRPILAPPLRTEHDPAVLASAVLADMLRDGAT